MDKVELITQYVRLVNFLTQNQLVQANAILQRMENMILSEFRKTPEKDPSEHPFFSSFKVIKVLQQVVIQGRTADALKVSEDLKKVLGEIK